MSERTIETTAQAVRHLVGLLDAQRQAEERAKAAFTTLCFHAGLEQARFLSATETTITVEVPE